VALFDNTWCLEAFNRYAGRTASGDSISDANKYLRLTEGQNRVIAEMSFRCPNSLYPKTGNLPTMTSGNGGNTWTFGTDANGYAIAPYGKARIFPTQNSFPDYAWIEGLQYVNEGTQIRLPNGQTWATPLYWYGIQAPADISASLQPSLFPEPSRELIVYEAVKQLSLEGGTRNAELAQLMDDQLSRAYPRWFAVWKNQFSSGGALGSLTGLRLTEAGGAINGQSWGSF
jgi:hypothetical protein